MIPKILHRMWLDKNIPNNTTVPKKYRKHIDSFEKYNSDFDVYFWNMERVNYLFATNPSINKYYDVWLNMPHHIQKCDFARFAILYVYGGVYVDLDFRYYKNLSPLLDRQLLLVLEPVEHSILNKDSIDNRLYNGFIGSVPNHPFWLDWMDFIVECLKTTSDVMETSGPVNFRKWFLQSRYSNTPLVDTCDILPFYIKSNGKVALTKICEEKIGTNKVTDDYHNLLNNYADTLWKEGTGWGGKNLKLETFDQPNKNNKSSWTNNIVLTAIFVCVIALLILMFYFLHNTCSYQFIS